MPDARLHGKFSMKNDRWKSALKWPEDTLQRHPQSLFEGFRNTNGVFGTDCTGAISGEVSSTKEQLSVKKENLRS